MTWRRSAPRSSRSSPRACTRGSAPRRTSAEQRKEATVMPPRGVKKGSKRARQYEHVKKSEKEAGRSEGRAEEIAARAVNKEKARSGETRTASRTSHDAISC